MKKLLSLLGVGGIAFGIYTFYLKQIEILSYLKYKLKGVKILDSTLLNVNLELQVEIINDSDISVDVSDYSFEIYINDIFVGTINNATTNQELLGLGGISVFPMKISVSTKAFISQGLISGLTTNFKKSTIRIKGTWGIKKGFIRLKDLPMDESYKVEEFM